ncbi:uncharacterized protein [Elaeis guineensis]|uniref:Reticulon-like protein B21 isoform X2 n=1 Tax=Elaeis guineensis var. tenera TaxID=51953 RepID=A0A8N4ESW8_ELAGV|nr:reticulon-like protein B21 isoform X2 [Elaeis guineensis]
MQGSTRRRALARNRVAAGSVWETRMRMDEVKGGIKVFNGDESRDDDGNADEDGLRVYRRLRRNQSDGVSTERRKRKNWRPPEPAASGSMVRSPIPLRKVKSELLNSPRLRGENCGEIGEEKVVLDGVGNDGGIGEKQVLLIDNGGGGGDEEEEVEIEVEEEKKNFDDKEMDVPVEKPKNVEEEERINQITADEKPKIVEEEKRINQIPVEKPKNVEEKRINKIHEIAVLPKVEKKPMLQVIRRRPIHLDPIKPSPVEVEEEIFVNISATQNRMQNIVNLVMWRDVSKTAFVFGFGTFFLLSSSYARDLNFSLITATSYLALVYLALIFLVKSILRRGATIEYDEKDERYMVGEEEAIWLLRLLLPYINELMLKLRALFSGEPATTMKCSLEFSPSQKCTLPIQLSWQNMANFGWRDLEMDGRHAPTRKRSLPPCSPSYGTSHPPSLAFGLCSCWLW